MKKNFLVFHSLFFFFSINLPAFGQTDSLLNLISDMSENETFYTDLLLELEEQPIQINYAGKEDFMQLPLISSAMADSIIAHREKYGFYTYIRQLRKIIDPHVYELLKPYLTTNDKGYNEMQVTHRDIFKIEKDPNIESGKYEGSALNSYTRIKYQYNPFINFGFISQKDPGEENFTDHISFYAHYKRDGWNVVAGNYYLQFALGLTHSNPYGNQKSTYLSAVFREPSSTVRPNISSSESSGKFGLFVEKKFSETITTFGFYSNSRRDAQLTENTLSGINYDGYHRSASEIAKRKYFAEENWGSGVKYNPLHWLHISAIINQYRFSEAIQNSADVVGENNLRRRYFNFSGDNLAQAAIGYVLNTGHLKLSGEYSSSDLGKAGWTQSAYFSKNRFKFGVQYWELDKNFQSIDGRSFDDSSPFPQGVKGFFGGIQFELTKNSTLSAYKKTEQRTWRAYFDPMPTAKSEWLTQWDWHLKKVSFTSRFRHRVNEEFLNGEQGSQRSEREQNNIRFQIDYKPVKTVTTRARWEHSIIENPNEKGSLFFQELNYLFSHTLSLSMRYTFFNTASWDSRIYEYERDLPGTFSNLALVDNGNKIYLLIKWRLYESISIWFKWRYIVQNDIFENGRYFKDINRDIRFQVHFRL